MFSKCLVLLLLQTVFPYGRGENPFLIFPQLPSENIDWNDLDPEGLRIILSGPLEAGNVTLVGYENVYGSDGSLQQINTIELTSLYQGAPDKSNNGYYYGGGNAISEFVQIKDSLYNETGTLLSGTKRQFLEYRGSNYFFVLNQNQDVLFSENDNIMRGFRNIRAKNQEQVTAFAKWLQEQSNVPISTLKWNTGKEFDKEKSTIVPFLFEIVYCVPSRKNLTFPDDCGDNQHGVRECDFSYESTVTGSTNATTEILDEALAGVSEAYLTKSDDVYKSISLYMQKKIPAYRWHVGEIYTYPTFPTDIQVDLHYNNIQVWENELRLSLYGVKK